MNTLWRRLLERLDYGLVEVTADETEAWPDGALDRLTAAGILAQATNPQGVACDGCEDGCWVIPEYRRSPSGAIHFVHACTVREGIGYMHFKPEQFQAWRIDAAGLAREVARLLSLKGGVVEIEPRMLLFLGERRTSKTRRTFYLASGLGADHGHGLAAVADGRMNGPHPVLLVPDRAPGENVWPRPPCSFVPLTSLLRWEDDALAADEDVLAAAIGEARRPPAVQPFPMPPGATWEHVFITILPPGENEKKPTRVKIAVRRTEETRTFAEMGMTDSRKKKPTPDFAWAMLGLIAQAGGNYSWSDGSASDKTRAHMKLLRVALKAVFGLEDDPFKDYERLIGWEPKFNLSDYRSVADPSPLRDFSRKPIRR